MVRPDPDRCAEVAEGVAVNVARWLHSVGVVLLVLATAVPSAAQSIEDLKKGVVKITAQAEGKTKVGTGFIVRLEEDAVYIVTAAHVVEGDPQPKVVFRGKETKSFLAQVKGTKGKDPRGVAVLVVEGNVPQGLVALPVSSDFEANGGEEVTVIGFPRMPAVPWAVTPGMVTGQEGEYLVFSGAAAEGNSGGPVLLNGNVIGVVTEVLSQYGYAVPTPIRRLALRGWGVSLEATPKEVKRVPERKGNKDQLPKEITGKDGAPMVLIPAGSFQMGSTKDEVDRASQTCVNESKKDQQICEGWYKGELPRHQVSLDAFYLDKYEVTNRLFARFVEATGHQTTAEKEGTAKGLVNGEWKDITGATWRQPEGGVTVFASNRVEHPIVSVSWEDANAYCRWAGKRLPTEAEFEYATRGGTQSKYWWGNDTPGARKVANVGDEFLNQKDPGWVIMKGYNDGYERTAPVGTFESNPFQLFDMTGNVSEWTADWYDANYYSKSPEGNPKGPSRGKNRVFRGGSWFFEPDDVRSANRFGDSPANRSDYIGFRCAQDIPK